MRDTHQTPLTSVCPVSVVIERLASRLKVVGSETLDIHEVRGRVLASDLLADRDSPASNVSAMDGYALRHCEYQSGHSFHVAGTCSAGQPAFELPANTVAKIFTGAPLPSNADTVIERESVQETDSRNVQFNVAGDDLKLGRHVRVQGENIRTNEVVLPRGTILSATAMAGIASFGHAKVQVHRKVRVSILNTGNELVAPGATVQPWQIRDSNGPVLQAMLQAVSHLQLVQRAAVADDESQLRLAIAEALADSDVVLLTGGVSMGDFDYVPKVLHELGVQKDFHRLPIKPGKPVYGGVGPDGQLVCALPGNPVSVAVTYRRIAMPLIRYIAGVQHTCLHGWPTRLTVANAQSSIPLVFYRLVELSADGQVNVQQNMGSGDLVSLSRSSGFIEFNPFLADTGEHRLFYRWDN